MENRDAARKMRSEGKTYTEISRELKIAKSTLFYWISDLKPHNIEFDRSAHLARIRVLASRALTSQRLKREALIKKKVKEEGIKINTDDKLYVRSLAAMLYWAEGSKGRSGAVFANTDPLLSKFYLTLLRNGFDIQEEKIKVRIHLHSYHNIEDALQFWSELLKVPLSQFGKIYIKPRSKTRKFRQNFAGICFIRYHSEALRIELLELGKEIASKYVPVAQLD